MATITDPQPRVALTNKTAKDIVRSLAAFHHNRDEVFMPEAEIHTIGRRFDGWAMKPSWGKPSTVGYEVKVSLADFRQDEKWPEYLPYCERFYFVSPPHLLDPFAVDLRAGLIWVLENGELEIVRKAKKRVMEPAAMHVMVHRMLFKYLYPDGHTLTHLEF